MKQSLYYLLILLLFSALADDSWALTTAEPADDISAAADNEYVQGCGLRPVKSRHADRPLPAPAPSPGTFLPSSSAPAPAPRRPRAGRALLSLLMSLQQ
jgi:hypothetical protein